VRLEGVVRKTGVGNELPVCQYCNTEKETVGHTPKKTPGDSNLQHWVDSDASTRGEGARNGGGGGGGGRDSCTGYGQ